LFSLLSKRQQQKQQESKRERREKVREGIKFILSHFKQPIFPRTISSINTVYYGAQFKVVYSEKEMLRVYEQSKFIDCGVRICKSLSATK
jgi:ribosomal protein S19